MSTKVKKLTQTYHIQGYTISRQTGEVAAGLRVEAWHKGSQQDSLLDVATSDGKGCFELSFDEISLGELPPGQLPDIFFKVWQQHRLVENTEESIRWNIRPGETSLIIETDSPGHPLRLASATETTEIVLHELGESIAVTVASVQEELARYPNSLGAYILDEIDLDLPVTMRIDPLGQAMTTVLPDEKPGAQVGKLHLRLRPVLGASQPPPVTSGQPLVALHALPEETIKQLEQQRIFTVDDLLRVGRTSAGRFGLTRMDIDLDRVRGRAALLYLPTLPPGFAASLLMLDVESPADFVSRDPVELAKLLSEIRGPLPLDPKVVAAWQAQTREFLDIPPSTSRSGQAELAKAAAEQTGNLLNHIQIEGD